MNKSLSRSYFSFFILANVLFLFPNCAPSPERILERIAEETQSNCPQVVDELTTMIDSELLSNRTLKFTYLVKGDDYTEGEKMELTRRMKPVLVEKLKKRKELEFYLVNNVRFEHLFLDALNKTVMHIQIEPLDYK